MNTKQTNQVDQENKVSTSTTLSNLNGVELIGSIVTFSAIQYVITNAHKNNNHLSEDNYFYNIAENGTDFYTIVPKSKLKFITLKTPLKKHIARLNSINKKIKSQQLKMDKEMSKAMKDIDMDNISKYDENELGMLQDNISYCLGLDSLCDEHDLLLNDMVDKARKVK